jgi:hypothetical protein
MTVQNVVEIILKGITLDLVMMCRYSDPVLCYQRLPVNKTIAYGRRMSAEYTVVVWLWLWLQYARW